MNIVIVTSGQPSANPRVVKEAVALSGAGFSVKVVYAPLSPWADAFDEQLFAQTPGISWIKAGYHAGTQGTLYKYARLRRKMYEKMYTTYGFKKYPERSYIHFAQELMAAAKDLRADVYIGHNLGALPVVVALAKQYGARCGFDAEDYHRGEAPAGSLQHELAVSIEEKYFPQLDYFTAAGPSIEQQYKMLFPGIPSLSVNNVFPIAYLNRQPVAPQAALKLWWFSQTVGQGRGIEDAITAMGILKNPSVSLTLLGNVSDSTRAYFTAMATGCGLQPDQLVFHAAVDEPTLHAVGNSYDIGLALEIPESENRKYCLTNKIFTYLLCGNAIVFSDTPAQRAFHESNKLGMLYTSGDAQGLAAAMGKYLQDKDLLLQERKHTLALAAAAYNWETEFQKLLQFLQQL